MITMRFISAHRLLVLAGLFLAVPLTATRAAGLGNVSALLQVPAGGASPSLGFIVTGTNTTFLFRAVGPSLGSFGIKNFDPAPQLHWYDGSGKEMFFSFITSVIQNWPQVFGSVGAFPLTSPGDNYSVMGFAPGAYTINVTDSTGKSGTVLIEIYQNPLLPSAAGNTFP
jgi:hypothetical protein